LARARKWLQEHVRSERGFWIEDKEIAIGLHYRDANPEEAQKLAQLFSEFVARETPRLKVMPLKMLAEAMPRAAGNKGRTVAELKHRLPESSVAAYFGDDTTDEDAFAALGANDVSVLVGPERATAAHYRVMGPESVRDELQALAEVVATRAKNSR